MSIRLKIVLVVLPVLVVAVVLAGMTSQMIASRAVTRVATEFLDFKASELEKYAESQWNLLVENGVADRPDMVAAARAGVEAFALGIVRSDTEAIVAVGPDGAIRMRTSSVEAAPGEAERLAALYASGTRGFQLLTLGGVERAASGFPFGPFGWYALVTEERDAFYGDVDAIVRGTAAILAASLAAAAALVLLFVRHLTGPLAAMVVAMRRIIDSGDLSERVPVEFADEIGTLSHTFNLMLEELRKAYDRIKKYAFDAVLAQKKEAKIRHIFQKFVPQELIDRFFRNPEEMLVGENRELAVLFSDIRSFTTISEAMRPDDLVNSLNRYFSTMVDIIMARHGVIDKYIGDAIMAFFGAPVSHADDAASSVLAALEMTEALDAFNRGQLAAGKPEFKIGIGINYGVVTVGNIGCDKKMDYTVIGDMVNLASRLEGLTKPYRQPLIFSEFLYDKVRDEFPCRILDLVAVKGKTKGVRIYTARRSVTPVEAKAWAVHEEAMAMYLARRFREASIMFRSVTDELGPDDYASAMMAERCGRYAVEPPPDDWDGVEVLHSK
ncbi:MAG TPA: adenylate/guanylate cyclase domain-containing protein [Spirochaetia bacterium]|nr:adenylate/guanylate cyclase domain-containing protein [Spirochaetales bacterium]HRW23902.1 adenylate/guanylate cyclase domain-containing protein [Spirochaetia bacterium]